MGVNGVFGYNNGNGFMNPWLPQAGLFGLGANPYLPTAGFLTSTLGYAPGNIWAARDWTQAAQSWTHCAAYPYGFHFNFTGRRNQYVVADPNQMSYQTALGLQTGQTFGGMNAQQLGAYFGQRNDRFVVNLSVTKIVSDLQWVQSIGGCKEKDYMKADENKELREEVIALEKQAEEMLKQFEEVMKEADSLSTEELRSKVNVYAEKAKTMRGQSDDLYKRIQEAKDAYNDKKLAAAEEEAKKKAEEAEKAAKETEKVENTETVDEDPDTEKVDETEKDDDTGKAEETKKQEGKPPEVKTSPKKTEVTEKGTKLEKGVKGKADGQKRTGKFYEYEGRIYQIIASEPEPVDKTDEVEKITA